MAQPFDDFGVSSHHSADHAKSLAKSADLNVHLVVELEMVHDAASAFPQNAFAVSVINHGHQVKFSCNFHEFVEGGVIAVHREHAVADNQTAPIAAGSLLDNPSEVGGVTMRVAVDLCSREARTINNRGMIEFVGKNCVFLTHEGGDGGAVGSKAGLEGDCCFDMLKLSHALLQFEMQAHRAGDRTHRARSHAILLHRLNCRFNQPGMVRQTQVIIGTKIQHPLSIDHHRGSLRRIHRWNGVVKASLL